MTNTKWSNTRTFIIFVIILECMSALHNVRLMTYVYATATIHYQVKTQLGSPSFTFDGVPLSLSSLPDRPPFSDSLASLFSLRMALSLSWMSSFLCSMASRAEFSESS